MNRSLALSPVSIGGLPRKAIAPVLDEIQIHLIPVLLGRGRRLFYVLPAEVELVRVINTPQATHIRYRVRRPAST